LLALLDGVAAIAAWMHAHATGRNARRVGASALAPAVVFASAMTVLPRWDDAPPAGGRVAPEVAREVLHAPAAVAVPVAPVAHHVVTTGAAATPKAPNGLPSVDVHHPGPGGGGNVWVRPKAPDDHFVCVQLAVGPGRCVDLPVHVTE
jgi:hypothetical protein